MSAAKGKKAPASQAPAKPPPPKAERELQAVLLADSFDRKYTPITSEQPRVLLPLVNVPMIEYALECLVSAEVKQVFIVTASHSDKIEKYFQVNKRRDVLLRFVRVESARTFGDAMRAVDETHLLTGEFILIRGDVVTNVDLKEVLKAFRARKESDTLVTKTVMTMVLKRALPGHAARSPEDDLTVALDERTQQLLVFDNDRSARTLAIPRALLEEHAGNIVLRTDLVDTGIYVCTPEVPAAFTENFDWSDLFNNYMRGVLMNEFLMQRIFVYVADTAYAARAKDLATYDAVSKHVIGRWADPVVPDNNLLCDTSYVVSRAGIYRERDVVCDRTVRVGQGCVLGRGCSIGAGSQLTRCVIGRNVTIGVNVVLHNCYVWDNAVVEDGVRAEWAIVCCGARLRRGAQLEPNTVVSYNVVVGEGVRVPAYTRLTARPAAVERPRTDSDSESADGWESDEAAGTAADAHEPEVASVEADVGPDGRGMRSNLAEDHLNALRPDRGARATGGAAAGADAADESESDVESETADYVDADTQFRTEVRKTVERALRENHSNQTLELELKSLRLTNAGKTLFDCTAGLLAALLYVIPDGDPKSIFTAAGKLFRERGELFYGNLAKSDSDQAEIVHLLVEECHQRPALQAAFVGLLKVLYDTDVVSEDAIMQWAREVADDEDDRPFLKMAEPLIKWLKEAAEESDDDDDDDGDDDDDDDDDDGDE